MTDTQFLERSDGSSIAYDVRGDAGPWVALVHGFAYPRLDLADLADLLARTCRVITVDNRGVGETTVDPEAFFTLEEMGADVLAVLADAGAEAVTLFGLSMGGGIVLHAAGQDARADAPLLARLIPAAANAGQRLVFPHAMADPFFEGLVEQTRAVMESLAMGIVPDDFDPGALVERVRSILAPATVAERPQVVDQIVAALIARPITPVEWLHQMHAGRRHEWTFEVPEIAIPATVLYGTEDVIINRISVERLAERLDAPLVLLEGAGHYLHRDQPERLAELIGTFAHDGSPASSVA